jgi:Na+-translocating ferredoxin:NAD+ oxidoreductase subunit G
MNKMIKLGLTLAAYSVASCFCLALVNNFTAPVITKHQAEKLNEGLKVVYQDADGFEQVTDFEKPAGAISVDELYLAKKSGTVVGAITKVTGPTYDHATILVGQNLKGIITGVQFLDLTDSPGFGLKAKDPSYKVPSGKTFYDQFTGKNAGDGFTIGSTYEAISGATITSKGVGVILTQATYTAGKYLSEKYGGTATGSAPAVQKQAAPFSYEDALKDMFPADKYGNITITEIPEGEGSEIHSMIVEKQFIVSTGGKVIAAAVSAAGQTYHNGGTVLTAVDSNRTIIGTRIIALEDTPNLGMRALEQDFYSQFTGKSADQDLRPGTDYTVLSGASITSDCIADIVKVTAYQAAGIMAKNSGKAATAGSSDYKLNEHYQQE